MNRFIQKYDFPLHLFSIWNFVRFRWSLIWNTFWTKLFLRMCGCPYGKNFRVWGKPHIKIYRRGQLSFGDDVSFQSKRYANMAGGVGGMSLECFDTGKITMGDGSGCTFVTLSSCSSITIGKRVMIGANAKIFDHDFHALTTEARRTEAHGDKTTVSTRPIVIEDDAFIGAMSLVLKGVTIGKGAVVAAGAVVTKSIPPGEIWGGNPAKFIKAI